MGSFLKIWIGILMVNVTNFKRFNLSKTIFKFFLIFSIIFAAAIVSLSNLYPIGSFGGGDGDTYLRISKLSILTYDFWGGAERMPLFPLFIKALNYKINEIIFVQQLIFILSIVYFCFKLFYKRDNFGIVGLICSALVFIIAINPVTSFVLHEFMTETLFYSGLIILLAEILSLDKKLNFSIIFFSILCLCFLRDEGVILCALFLPAIIYKFTNSNLKNLANKSLILIAIIGLAFSYSFIYKEHRGYSNERIGNIVLMRVAYDSMMEKFFVKSGMIIDNDYNNLKGYGSFQAPKGSASCFQDSNIPICTWSIKNGWNSYIKFLIRNPLRLLDPFLLGKSVDNSPLSAYQSDASLADIMSQSFSENDHYLEYKKMPTLTNASIKIGGLNLYFSLFVFGLALVSSSKNSALQFIFVASGLFSSAIIVYHSDAAEVVRHLATYALALRLFTAYLIFNLIELLLVFYKKTTFHSKYE
jgi:hypothetical protein